MAGFRSFQKGWADWQWGGYSSDSGWALGNQKGREERKEDGGGERVRERCEER